MEEPLGTSPPLELRRTVTGQRVAVPHSLQSPQDRATGKLFGAHLFNAFHFIENQILFLFLYFLSLQ